jgi:hypothetical protein
MANAKFLTGHDEKAIAVPQKQISLMVDLALPEEVKESMPLDVQAELNGVFCLNFYCLPAIGHTIKRLGHRWKIADIEHSPTRYLSRETKFIPVVSTEYIGKE